MAEQDGMEAVGRDLELRRMHDLGEQALEAFGVAGARLSLLEHKQNTTFRVRGPDDGEDGGFLLRICMAGRYPAAVIRSEMLWLRSLEGLGAPQPQSTVDGSLVAELPLEGEGEPRCCVLLRWVPGQLLSRSLEPSRAAEIGELLARLHRHAEGFTPPPEFERPRWDLDRLLGRGEVLPAERLSAASEALVPPRDRALLEEAAAIVRDEASALGEDPELFGLIHTDLEPDNVILDRGTLRPIDFEHSGWGYYLYDIGASLLALADQKDFPALKEAFLAGYQRIRPLPAAQLERLDTFLVLRCLFSLRLIFLEIWDWPGTREDAVSMVPFMIGGIRRILERRSPAGKRDDRASLKALSTVRFLSLLRSRGIQLRAEEEEGLRFSAPKGALGPELRDELQARKAADCPRRRGAAPRARAAVFRPDPAVVHRSDGPRQSDVQHSGRGAHRGHARRRGAGA